jgi:hypothetical protein
VLVFDDVWNCPPGHAIVFSAHRVAALVPILKLVTPHAVHVLSAVCTFDSVKNLPASQSVVLSAQAASALVPGLKWVAKQALHSPVRASRYVPAAHARVGEAVGEAVG